MKTLAELDAIRKQTQERINLRKEDHTGNTRVVVGMATCGIAAGARPVMLAFSSEVARRHLEHVTITQTGCIGMCRLEPMVDVYTPGSEKVTYVHVNAEMVSRIVAEHVVNGRPVAEFTIGAAEHAENAKE
jgi:NADP-reducing hydrogenase subunit HndB